MIAGLARAGCAGCGEWLFHGNHITLQNLTITDVGGGRYRWWSHDLGVAIHECDGNLASRWAQASIGEELDVMTSAQAGS